METLRVGVVGLSPMMRGVARRLAAGGARVTAYDPDRSAAVSLASARVLVARLPADAAEEADVLVLDAPTDRLSEEWLFDFGGVGETLPDGGRVLDVSRTGIAHGSAATRQLRTMGLRRVEAALVGNPAQARAGALRVLVGGDADDLDMLAPLLAALSDDVEIVGPVGSVAALRLVTASLAQAREAALTQALAYAEALGAPLDAAWRADDLLTALGGSGGQLSAYADVIPLPQRRGSGSEAPVLTLAGEGSRP